MKKLLLFPFLIGSSLSVSSQILNAGDMFPEYQDINPDTLLNYVVVPFTNEVYSLDLFGDSNNDIQFTARGSISSGGSDAFISVASLDPNVYIRMGRLDSVYAPGTSSWVVTRIAEPLGTGQQINTASAAWDNTTLYLTDHTGHDGANKNVNDWVGGDRFMGLKYQGGSTVYYAWLRINCPSEDSCYLKDYAVAGTVGIEEKAKVEAAVYPNPLNDHFYLKNIDPGTFDITKLKLKDLFAKEVKFSCEIKGNNIKIDPDPALPNGCYVLEYSSGNISFAKKLIKINK